MMMQKKNMEVSPSVESTIPSNQPLASEAQTTTVEAPAEVIPGQAAYIDPNLQSHLPSASGISVSAPSTLDARQKTNVDRVESLKNKTREVMLASPVFDDSNPNSAKNKEIYFNSFKKMGYSDKEIAALKKYGSYIDESKKQYQEAAAELAQYQNAETASADQSPATGLTNDQLSQNDFAQSQEAAASMQAAPEKREGPVPTALTYKLATSLLGLGKYDEAVNFFTKTLGNIQAPDTGERVAPAGEMSMNIQTTYNAADNPSNSLYGIGYALSQKGQYEDAIGYFWEALKADPENSSAQKGLAYAKYKLGDRSEYKQHLQEVANIDESQKPNLALVGQINEEAKAETEQQRQSDEMKGIADSIEAFATGDREGKLGFVGFLNPIGKMISGIQKGTEKASEGVIEAAKGDVVEGAVDLLSGIGHVAFSAIPEVQAFNTVLAGINETAKQTLSEENAKLVEDTLNLPFTAATAIASNILGYDPKENSLGKKVLDLADIIASFGAMHAIGKAGATASEGVEQVKNSVAERIKSFDDLKAISKEASEGKLSETEMGELKEVTTAMSNITPKDILEEAHKNPDLKKDVEKVVDDGGVSPESKDLHDKLSDLEKAVSNPEISPETKSLYETTINDLKSSIDELNNTETTDHVVSAETQVKIDEINDQVNLLKSDLEKAESNTEKDVISQNIDLLEQQKQQMSSVIEPVKEGVVEKKQLDAIDNKTTDFPQTESSSFFKNEAHTTEGVDKISSEIKDKAADLENGIDELKDGLPTEKVDINDIVPTQKYVFDDKIGEYEKNPSSDLPLLIKSGEKYYIEDGHNRIAADVKAGRDIQAKIYEEKPVEAEPPKTPEKEVVSEEDGEEKKVHAIWKNALSEIKDEELKKGIEKKGIDYIVKKDAITESSAREVMAAAVSGDKLKELEKIVLDDKNEMDNTTRGVMSALLGKHYFDLAESATDIAEKESHYNEFYKYTDRAAALATEGGQAGNAIGKIIKKMYVSNPETVIAKVKKHFESENEKVLEEHKEKISNTYEAIKKILETEEGQAAITEAIEKKAERLFGKETQKKISDLFDKAKIDTKGTLNSSIIPPQLINAAIEVMKQAALLGAKGAEIIEEGIRHIKESYKDDWDEAEFRKEWEKKLKDSGIKFGKKKSVSEKQKVSILDAIEKKANKLKPENRDKFLKDVVQEVESEGGLSEQRFKELYAQALGLPSMTADLVERIKGFAKIINEGESSEKAYLKALDDIIDAENTGASKDVISDLQKIKNEALKKSLNSALQAKKANEDLSELFKGNKKLADTLIGMMQLGALTPKSIIKNVTAMPAELAFRALSGHVTGALDLLLTGMANIGLAPESWKDRKVNSFARAKGAFYAHPKAFRKMYENFLHGSFAEDYTSREINNKITPVRAFKNLVEGKTNKDASAMAANIVEALPMGYMAAAFGRALAGPDAFFRTIGENAKAYELGRLDGLDGAKLEKYMAEPPAEAADKIKKEGDRITFQQDNAISEGIKGAKAYIDRFYNGKVAEHGEPGAFTKFMAGAMRVLSKSQALYIKTPTNVLGSTLRMISPELSIAKAAYHLSKGNKELFAQSMADASISYALRYVVVSAIKNGMVTSPVDYQSKEGKAQSDNEIKHAGKFNKSAYWRMMSGGDWKEKNDDVWVDYTKWTGGIGIAMGAYANMLDGMSKEDMNIITMSKNSGKTLPAVFQQVMDLSFMSTTAQLVDALRDKDGKSSALDKWIASTIGTLSTPLLPNTVATISKAGQETKKETRGATLIDRIKNDFKYKLFMGSDLPSKISLWGTKVTTAQKGDNRYLSYIFDVTASENPNEDALSYKIMELYHKTGDDKVLPTPPSNQITVSGKRIPLTPQQFESLQIYVGTTRKELAQEYLNTDQYLKDDDNERIRKLGRIYADSHKIGTDMLINSDDNLTDTKNDLSGVSPVTGNRHNKRKRDRPKRNRR
jgi:tetratricopeptide (TPR) repeat protein